MSNNMHPSAKVYDKCSIVDSSLAANVIVGDYSQVVRSRLCEGVRLQRFQTLFDVSVGKHSYTGRFFTAWDCSIGSFCSISWSVSIGGANHDYERLTTHAMLYNSDFGFLGDREPLYDRFGSQCVIGNDVWIGCGSIINRGVVVGDGAVIGAGSVVTKDVEPYSIVAGSPARKIRMRFSDEVVSRLLVSNWWELPDSIIKENLWLFGGTPGDDALDQLERICNLREDAYDPL